MRALARRCGAGLDAPRYEALFGHGVLAGREVELTGFAVPTADGEGWYLARLQMACCAADAVVNKVVISGVPAPEADTWWKVRGTWIEPEGELSDVSEHGFEVVEMEEVTDPPDPYE